MAFATPTYNDDMNTQLTLCLLAALTSVLPVSSAKAQRTPCEDLLHSIASAKTDVHAIVSTLNINGTASFAEFDLHKFPLSQSSPEGGLSTLDDSHYSLKVDGVREYFSDRRKGTDPFDPAQTDEINVEIQTGVGTPSRTRVFFTLVTHGSGQMELSPTCENDMIFGWGGPKEHNRDVYYVIKLLR